MKFLSVSIKNYKSYGDNEDTLNLSENGIRLITGKNGFGKSAVIESIVWCLYGRSLVSIDEVVNRYIKKNCKVGVNFEIGGQKYTVYRYRKHDTHANNLYLFKDDKNVSLKNQTDTQQLIQDIIQIPYQAMVSSFIFSSETYSSFLRSKNAERLKIVESVLFLKEITSYYDIVKKKLKEVDEKRGEQLHEEDKVVSAIETITKNLEEYNTRTKNTLLDLKKKKEENETRIKKLQEEFEVVSKLDLKEEFKKIEKYEQVLEFNSSINSQIKSFLKEGIDFEKLKDRLTDEESKLTGLKEIDVQKEFAFLERIEVIKNRNSQIQNEIKLLEAGIVNTDNTSQLQKIGKEKEKIVKEVETIHSNQCPLCGQAIGEETHKEILSLKNKKLEELNSDIDIIIKHQKEQAEKNLKIQVKIDELKERIEVLPFSEYDTEFLHDLNTKINELERNILNLNNSIEKAQSSGKLVAELKSQLKEIKEVPTYKKSELIEFETIHEQIAEAKKNIENVNEQAKSVYDKKYVESFKEKISKLNEYKTTTQEKLKSIDEERRYFSVLSDLFSNKENSFKKYFIDRIIGVFNKNINFYLPLFFDSPIEIVFDKELTEVINYDGYEVPFDSFSSGQKTRIDLAIAISLFMLVKTFFSTSVNIIVFDEILDQNLDACGVNAVISILENMASENGVLIISHRDEYKDRFPKQIEIRNKDKFSYIYEGV